jgi:deoxyhypusine synthase
VKKVIDIHVNSDTAIHNIIKLFEHSAGFTASKLTLGAKILLEMESNPKCFKFLSFPADIISTGVRGIIVDLIKQKKFDFIITTTGTLDHDLARLWSAYYIGTERANDAELRKKKINRLYNVFIPYSNYGNILEDKLQPIFQRMEARDYASYELVWEIGRAISKERKREESIVYWAYKNQIPIVIPGFTDGAVGFQAWMYYQKERKFTINPFKDEDLLAEVVFKHKITGALMIGGGISKHHTIWWNQFKKGLDYAVYVTTANEWDGSLSGAPLEEAISWGKVKPNARQVTIHGEASVILPLLVSEIL